MQAMLNAGAIRYVVDEQMSRQKTRVSVQCQIIEIQAHRASKDVAYLPSIAVPAFLCLASPSKMLVTAFYNGTLETYLHHFDPLLQVLRDFGSTFPALCT
jgi:hypothetical protein